MTAIVSGNSLGLNLGSMATLGARGVRGQAAEGGRGEGVYVNVATGNLVLQASDELLVGRGPDAAALRTYNSQGLFNDDNGDNWTSGFHLQPLALAGTLGAAGSSLTRTDADGSAATYQFDGSSYRSTEGDGAHDTITWVAARGELEWRDGGGTVLQVYQAAGAFLLLATRDTSGNGLSYTYNAAGRVVTVTSTSGDRTCYDYDGANNLAQLRTVDAAGVTRTGVRYTYDAGNRLVTVSVDLTPADNTAADGQVFETTYGYDGTSKRVASISRSDGTSVAFTYAVDGGGRHRVASVTNALGQRTSFSYAAGSTVVTDAANLNTTHAYDAAGRLTQVTSPLGGTGRFTYSGNGDVTSVQDGQGRTSWFEYDARGNQLQQRDSLGNSVRRTFDARNQLVTETVYAVPDPDGAGPVDAGQPAMAFRVYDGGARNLLRFEVGAAGRVIEHRYDGLGQRSATIVHAGASYPVAGLTAGTLPSESTLATWAAAQPVAGWQRTDLEYDYRGELQARVRYAKVDAAGTGVADGTHSRETFVRNQRGQLLSTIDATGHRSGYTYDGLGRVLSATDALGQVTVTRYTQGGMTRTVTQASGLVQTSVFDAAGRLVTQRDTTGVGLILGETRHHYDPRGLLRMTVDPTGVRSWRLYDDAGRKVADVDGNGSLTEYTLDAAGVLVSTLRHATAVDTTKLVDPNGQAILSATLAGIRPLASAADSRTWLAHDAAGRLVREAHTIGTGIQLAVTATEYDGASRVTRVTRYKNTIEASQATPGSIALPTANAAEDRVTRHLYDADGLLAGTLDAEGYLTSFSYTAAGQLLQRTAHALPSDPARRANGTLLELLPADHADHQRTRYYHDAKGLLAGELDALGYLTEYWRDGEGRITRTIRYATATATPTASSTVATLRPASSAADRVVTRSYDPLARLKEESSSDGLVKRYTYDSAGNLISTELAPGTADRRTQLARYDLQGRVVAELSGEGAAATIGATAEQVAAAWTAYGRRHEYDAAGRRTSTRDGVGGRSWFHYNADGALTHTVNALGEVKEQRYDALGRPTEEVAYAGRIATDSLSGGLADDLFLAAVATVANAAIDSRSTVGYLRDGQVGSRTDALGNVTSHGYNAFGEETSLAQAGLTRSYTVDRRGSRLTSSAEQAVTSAQYDAFGRVVRQVDALGNARVHTYDRLGRTLTGTDALDGKRQFSYDAFGQVLAETDPLGRVTRFAYDQAKRTLVVTTPEGVVTETTRSVHGQVQTVTDGKGQVTSYGYDGAGALRRTATGGVATAHTHDAAGRLAWTLEANGTITAYSYDAADRVLSRRVDAGGLELTTRYQYDGQGQQVSVTDPNGVVTSIAYDRDGQVVDRTVDPGGLQLKTAYTYDPRGHVVTVTAPAGTVTRYVYDTRGRRIAESVDPSGLDLKRSWSYDDADNVVASTDPTGQVTRYFHDAEGRRIYTVDPLGNVLQQGYDAAGRQVLSRSYAAPIALTTTMTRADVQARVVASATDAVEHRVYDGDGRMTATVDGTGGVVRYTYDANGNVVARTSYAARVNQATWVAGTVPRPSANAALDEQVRTIYDSFDRAIYTVDGAGGVVGQSYDAAGNVVRRVAYANAIAPATAATAAAVAAAIVAAPARDESVSFTYDAAGRKTWSVDGTGAVRRWHYDRNGNVVREIAYANLLAAGAAASSVAGSTADHVRSLAYDAANRLALEVDALNVVTERAYDGNGNLLRRSTYARALAATPALGAAAGVVRASLVGDGLDRHEMRAYDSGGRLVFEVNPVGAAVEYGHDAAGRLASRKEYANHVSASLWPSATPAQVRTVLASNTANDRLTLYVRDAAGREVRTVDAVGAVVSSHYDGAGRLVGRTRHAKLVAAGTAATVGGIDTALGGAGAADQVEQWTHDAAGRVTRFTDPLGAFEVFTYDGVGRKSTFGNKKGAVWKYEYDAGGRMVAERTPTVEVTSLTLHAAGALQAAAPQSQQIVTRFSYDALGRLASRTEAWGTAQQRTTTYEYDAAGRQVRVVHPKVRIYDAAADASFLENGASGLARTEMDDWPDTSTWYDAFGHAVASLNVTGGLSQKVYDKAGRVVYEVDALGYVTGHVRDAFGQVTSVVRHGGTTSLAQRQVTQASHAVTAQAVTAALTAAGFAAKGSRTLHTRYDQMGRVVEVVEPAVYVTELDAAGQRSSGLGSPLTRKTYDAFGQLIQEARLRNALNTWSVTTHFHDRAGRRTATVDALDHLTTRTYDAVGNLTEQKEWAAAVPSRTPTGGVAAAEDRLITYTYDRLNRKTAESHSTGNTTEKATTGYGYDALGNQTSVTDALGGVTTTQYDVLGRVVAVAAPGRPGPAGQTLVPLTLYRRDVHGNAVVTTSYANGAVSATSLTAMAPDAGNDRTTYEQYDVAGRLSQRTDANGASEFFSYDVGGRLVKQWRKVTGLSDSAVSYQFNSYDGLGRLTQTRVPASNSVRSAADSIGVVAQSDPAAGDVRTTMEYNAYGEMISRGLEGGREEFFRHDDGGRLWLTNTGDGVTRIKLHDALGNVTAELASHDLDLGGLVNAQTADMTPGVRRTDIRYDALGRVLSRQGAARQEVQGGVFLRPQFVTVGLGVFALEDGRYKSEVQLGWNDIDALGSGDVKVAIEYMALAGWVPQMRRIESELRNGAQCARGTKLELIAATHSDSIVSVTRVIVSKKDRNGEWKAVIDQVPGYGSYSLELAAPPQPDTDVQLQLRRLASQAWENKALSNFGEALFFDTRAVPPAQYEYRVVVTPKGNEARVSANGILTVTDPLLNVIAPVGFDLPDTGSVLAWSPPGLGTTEAFRYRPVGSSASEPWRVLLVAHWEGGKNGVECGALATGSYEFELLWNLNGTLKAHATGVLRRDWPHGYTVTLNTTPGAPATLEASTAKAAYGLNGDVRALRPTVHQKTDRWGNVVEMSDPRSALWKTRYRYDGNNQLVWQRLPDNNGQQTDAGPVTEIFYDKLGRQVAVKDPNGNIERQVHDGGGNLVQEVRADGTVVGHAYGAFGQKLSTTDPRGKLTAFVYDRMGNLLQTVKPEVGVYGRGNMRPTDSWTYDELGRKLTHANGNGQVMKYRYDLAGNIIATVKPSQATTRAAFDAHGRKTAEWDGNGKLATWSYDYFGRLLAHSDKGKRAFTYRYNHAGQSTEQWSGGQLHLQYVYDAAGQLTQIHDWLDRRATTYQHDLAGRHVQERVVQDGSVYQDNHLSYDTRGNLVDVADARVHLTLRYDAAGNRKQIHSRVNYQGVSDEQTQTTDRWFAYDSMNRQVVVDAMDANLALGAQGHRVTYDKAGNRASDQWQSGVETYEYDALNRLHRVVRNGVEIDLRLYDAADRLVRSGTTGVVADPDAQEMRLSSYDPDGRMLNQQVFTSAGVGKMDISWSNSTISAPVALGYDAEGNVTGYATRDHSTGRVTSYSNEVMAFDGYKPFRTTVQSSGYHAGVGVSEYDVSGALVKYTDQSQPANTRRFVNDVAGQALYVEQDGRILRQLIVNGEVLGIYGVAPTTTSTGGNTSFANIVDFDFGYSRITATFPGATPGSYQVRIEDTLKSIAQQAYGDSALWYRIAEANGLASDNDLRVGQTLNIPTAISGSNNAMTFKPYDPSRIEGDRTPTMTLPAPAGRGGCGGVGKLLMVVVAVAVTIYTAGALASGTGAFMAAMNAGVTASAGYVAAGAAVGSIASQVAGLATGDLDKFSWKSVALAASGGALGGSIGPAGSAWQNVAMRMALSSASTQGIAIVTGLQRSFDWRAVAAAAVGGAVSSVVGGLLKETDFLLGAAGNAAVSGAVKGVAGGISSTVARGGRVTGIEVLADAFGNALGESLASASSGAQASVAPEHLDNDSTYQLPGPYVTRDNPDFVGDQAWAADLAGRRPAMNKYGLPTAGGAVEADAAEALRLSEIAYRNATEVQAGGRSLWQIAQTIAGSGAVNAEINAVKSALIVVNPNMRDPNVIPRNAFINTAIDGVTISAQDAARIVRADMRYQQALFAKITPVSSTPPLDGDITAGDLDLLNTAFARRDQASASINNFVGPLQPQTSFGRIAPAPAIGLGHRVAGAVLGEPLAFVTQLAGGLPVNTITNELMNFEGADRKLLAILGVSPVPFIKAGAAVRVSNGLAAAAGREVADQVRYTVGLHSQLKALIANKGTDLNSHHAGQKAQLQRLIADYDMESAPAILVPAQGHTRLHPDYGIVSRSGIHPRTGESFRNARDVLARDVWELRRVYPEIPNTNLQQLIRMNKKMYPEMR